jgi:ABC-type Mn2+/Zn2+ transport system permease subunit
MNDQFFLSLLAGVFVGGISGYLGSLMLTKRMALVGDALGHVALPGMGLAILLHQNVSIGAFVFLFLGILCVWAFEVRTLLPTELLVGIVFVVSLAVGFLITPEPELLEALFGDITRVSLRAALASVILSIGVFFLLKKIYPQLLLANISRDLAKVQGIKIKANDFLFLFSIAVVVALGIRVTGSLLVGSLVIIPAAIARNVSRSLRGYTVWSIACGVGGSIVGLFLYRRTGLPAGPLIILLSGAVFLLSLAFRRQG